MTPSPVYGRSRDQNEREIVQALEKLGWLVVRHDVYDLDIACPRCKAILALEVKQPKGQGKNKGRHTPSQLTPSQLRLIENGWPLRVVTGVGEALKLVREHRSAAGHSFADPPPI